MTTRYVLASFFTLFLTLTTLPISSHAAGKGFYPNGQLKWEYLFQDGKISEAKWYNETGQLVSRELYVDGQPEKTEGFRADGSLEWQAQDLENGRQEVTRFDEAGAMTAKYQVLDDQTDGEYTIFYPDGTPKQSVTYQMGVLEGPARTYFPSGQVENEFTYRNGEVDGVYRTFAEDGTLLSEYTFTAGQLQ